MSRSIRRLRLALPALLIALGAGTALAVPAQAASSWSPPVQLPAGCVSSGSVPGLAVNAAGTEAAAGSQLNAGNSSSVLVCTSADGQTWPAPATVGQGTNPAVALAPDGRAVTAWEGGPFTAPVIQASIRPPGGTWSAPVTVGTDARGPLIGIDRSGNTIIAWAGGTGTIHTASLPAGGSWDRFHLPEPRVGDVTTTKSLPASARPLPGGGASQIMSEATVSPSAASAGPCPPLR